MDNPVTLKSLLEQHPEWADVPIAIYQSDGSVVYVGGAGSVYEMGMEVNEKVLIFTGN